MLLTDFKANDNYAANPCYYYANTILILVKNKPLLAQYSLSIND